MEYNEGKRTSVEFGWRVGGEKESNVKSPWREVKLTLSNEVSWHPLSLTLRSNIPSSNHCLSSSTPLLNEQNPFCFICMLKNKRKTVASSNWSWVIRFVEKTESLWDKSRQFDRRRRSRLDVKSLAVTHAQPFDTKSMPKKKKIYKENCQEKRRQERGREKFWLTRQAIPEGNKKSVSETLCFFFLSTQARRE